MDTIRADGRDVWINVEPDLWGYIKNNNACGTTGKNDVDRFLSTRPQNAHLGFFISPWNVPYAGATQDALDWKNCYQAAGGNRMEDIYVDVSDRDQEFKGTYPWPSSKFTQYEDWFKALQSNLGKKVSIWQIPMGNSSCNNSKRSNFVETWLTTDKLTALSPYVNRMLFGPGIEGGGSAQSWNLTVHDIYDCGFFNNRVSSLLASLPPPVSSPASSPVSTPISTPSPTPVSSPVPTLIVTPTNGFTGKYYDNLKFSTLKVTRTDSAINFDWGYGSPATSISPDTFSVRWTGNINFSGGNYTFKATVDDGMKIWIDGIQVLNKWFDQPATTYTFNRTLTAGVHTVRIDYYENYGSAVAKLSWTQGAGGGTTSSVLEAENMALPSGDGQVFTDNNASGSKALLIWSDSSATGQISQGAKSLVVRARGDQCSGAPHMVIKVDDVQVLSTNVTSSSWADYTAPVSLGTDTHGIVVIFDNDYFPSCDRNLRIDKITLNP